MLHTETEKVDEFSREKLKILFWFLEFLDQFQQIFFAPSGSGRVI